MLYGKWRPRGFDEVAGQDHIVTTLRNALASGQVAHAYLFAGPRGTGKTTTARILARAVNCVAIANGEPCNECASCIAIAKGAALDLIEMDAASNRGIDDIRELREKVAFAPSDLKMKVYLLDEVHMLTDQAFNALLKTLEEPPPHAIFILATTELQKMPATIISRCQRYDFHRIPNEALVARLRLICDAEGFAVPEQGLLQVAIQSRGGARDAITLLEQVVARYGPAPSTDDVLEALGLVHDERSEELVGALFEGDLARALEIARAVADDGLDISRFTREAIDIIRAVLPQLLRKQPDDGPYRALAEAGIAGGPAVLTTAVNALQELAGADFRLDPASPVPLEVACAAAVLGQAQQVVVQQVPAPPAAGPARGRTRPEGGARPAGPDNGGEATTEERFLKELYQRCSMVDYKLAARLNGSCEVLSVGDDVLEMGFYFPLHMETMDTEGRPLLEAQAQEILGRPVTLKLKLVERQTKTKKAPRGGHLAEAALAMGAKPVGKD